VHWYIRLYIASSWFWNSPTFRIVLPCLKSRTILKVLLYYQLSCCMIIHSLRSPEKYTCSWPMKLAPPPICVYSLPDVSACDQISQAGPGNEATKNHVNTILGGNVTTTNCIHISSLHVDNIPRVRHHSILYRKVTKKLCMCCSTLLGNNTLWGCFLSFRELQKSVVPIPVMNFVQMFDIQQLVSV